MGFINSLPRTATVSYNGLSFNAATRMTINSRAEYDDSGRSPKYWIVTITIIGEVEPDPGDPGTEYTVQNILELLSQPRKALTIQNAGYVTLTNLSSDMNYGPKPRIISWEPIGGRQACRVAWSCEVCLAFCPYVHVHVGITAWGFSSTYTVTKGIVTRTLSGFLEVNYPASVHSFIGGLQTFLMEVPPGFNRESQTYRISTDDSKLMFDVTDKAINSQVPYPPYVIGIEATHTIQNTYPGSCQGWTHNIRASIDLPLSVHNEYAWEVFRNIIKVRLGNMKLKKNKDGSTSGFYITDVSATESIFGKSHTFAVTIKQSYYLQNFINGSGSGLFSSLQTNWVSHRDSLEIAGVNTPKGFHGLERQLQPTYDYCEASDQVQINPDIYYIIEEGATLRPKEPGSKDNDPEVEKGPKLGTYIGGKSTIRGYSDKPFHKLLALQDTSDVFIQDGQDPNIEGGAIGEDVGGEEAIIQKTGDPNYKVEVRGYAKRVGFEVSPPALRAINGQPVTEVTRNFVQWEDGMLRDMDDNELPVYAGYWSIIYEATNALGGLPIGVLPNLSSGSDGTAQL